MWKKARFLPFKIVIVVILLAAPTPPKSAAPTPPKPEGEVKKSLQKQKLK
jgi:hypothetical protein